MKEQLPFGGCEDGLMVLLFVSMMKVAVSTQWLTEEANNSDLRDLSLL